MEPTTDIGSAGAPESSIAQPPSQPEYSLGYAWYVVIILMIAYTLSFIDRQILALLVGPIRADLSINDTQIGLLGGLAFALFYTLMGLPLGRIIDRHNRKNVITLGILFWSLATAACAMARSFGSLFAARAGVGVGEATLGPGAMSILADYFDKEHLGTAMSVYSMGIYIGSGLAFMIGGTVVQAVSGTPIVNVPLLGDLESWRLAFLIVGIPGILVGLWVYTIKEPARKGVIVKDGAASHLSIGETINELKERWTTVGGLSVGMMFIAMAVYSFLFWSPVFMDRVFGWGPALRGNVLGILFLVFGCGGMFLGGRLSDYWLKRGVVEGPLRVGIIAGVGGLVSLAIAFMSSSPVTSLIFLAPGVLLTGLPTGVIYAGLQVVLPNQVRGQAVALFLFILNIGGLTLGPLLPGVFNDYLFQDGAMVGYSTAISTSIACIGAAVIFALTLKPYKRDYRRMHPA